MIKCNKGELEIKGKENEIKAELSIIFMGLYEKGYNKDDIFESLSYCELFGNKNIRKIIENNKDDILEDLKKILKDY